MKIRKIFSINLLLLLFIQCISPLTDDQFYMYPPLSSVQGDESRDSWVWLPRTLLSVESTESSGESVVEIDQWGNIHVIWVDQTPMLFSDHDADLFYRMWNATTRLWTYPELITTESAIPNLIWDYDFKVDGNGNRHVIWSETGDYLDSGSDKDIYYKYYDNTLKYWRYYELLTEESTTSSIYTSLAVDVKNDLHMVWVDSMNITGEGTEGDVYYMKKNSITGEWTGIEVVSGQSNMSASFTDVAVDSNGSVHVVWRDSTDIDGDAMADIFYCSRNETGWSSNAIISTESTNDTGVCSILCDNEDNLHVAWSDYTDFNSADSDVDIFYKYYDFSLGSWKSTLVVSTESTDDSYHVAMTCDDDGNIHFVWDDYTNYHYSGGKYMDIFYKYYDVESDYLSYTELISTDSANGCGAPSVISYENALHVFWSDLTPFPETGNDIDIYYRKFTGPPVTPILPPILSEHITNMHIALDWVDCSRASRYYIYRSESYFTSIEGLTPVAVVDSSSYTDTLPEHDTYYYSVVAGNYELNSSMSNIAYVTIEKYQLSIGLGELLLICGGFVLLQALVFIFLSRANTRKTKTLLENYPSRTEPTPTKQDETKSNKSTEKK